MKNKDLVVIGYQSKKYALTLEGLKSLKTLDLKGKNLEITVFGYSENNKTNDDMRISLDRAIEIKKALLKLAPNAKITAKGGGVKKIPACAEFSNRCAVVRVTKR